MSKFYFVATSTDVKIRNLFGDMASAKDEAELRRVASELESAMIEHAQQGKISLAKRTSASAGSDDSGRAANVVSIVRKSR